MERHDRQGELRNAGYPPQAADVSTYTGMIALIDHNVGRILAALDAFGLAEDTLMVYPIQPLAACRPVMKSEEHQQQDW